jgi:Protein of unknown function (DUF3866)
MPLGLRRGTVTAVHERLPGLVRLEVDGDPCVAYPRLTGPVALGDEVLVNAQARELALGSGGFDVLHANLTRGLGLAPEPGAHVMTLPYTPLQAATPFAEQGRVGAERLDGMPVVCCTLHSQVAPVAAALADLRVAYVQVAGGALPVSLSDTVRVLRRRGLVTEAIAAAPCLDGDLQCASVPSALLVARTRGAEVVIAAVGPGIVGTGSAFGHGATTLAEVANATAALGGDAVLAVRVSEADARDRHRGVSHHTRAVLSLSSPTAAWPAGAPDAPAWLEPHAVVDTEDWREACAGLPLDHMGRGPDDDPHFFEAAFAAGRLARKRVR